MGVPTPEVGYTPAMPRREGHEIHKAMWWHWTKKTSCEDGLMVPLHITSFKLLVKVV